MVRCDDSSTRAGPYAATAGRCPPALEGGVVPATVPGCVHTDLLAAGLVPDPYLDENEARWPGSGDVDWRYETTFDGPDDAAAAHDGVELVADGLDTVATVELERHGGRPHGEHAPLAPDRRRRPCGRGSNTLAVTFAAPATAAERASEELGPRPGTYRAPFNAIRKMACSYGWDWGPA